MLYPANEISLLQYEGCVLGLALGDAFGAPHEGGFAERLLWLVIGRTINGQMRWTDDTQMSIDLSESLLKLRAIDLNDIARHFAAGYRWSRGYGKGTAKVLKLIKRGYSWQEASRAIYQLGSFGNGAAMRSPILALFYGADIEATASAAVEIAMITHAHPYAVEGAVLIACATACALTHVDGLELLMSCTDIVKIEPFKGKLALALAWLKSGHDPTPAEVVHRLGNGVAASDSCATAVYIASRFLENSFEDLLSFTRRLGGDVDTIGSMAGAIWGAARGRASFSDNMLRKVEQKERLISTAAALFLMREIVL